MGGGALIDAIEQTVTLKSDVQCILLNCHRDRPWVFAAGVTEESLAALADRVASELAPLIGGRYVPQNYARERMDRERRDAAVWAAFTGDNHPELMCSFNLSRRQVYAILAKERKKQRSQTQSAMFVD